MWWVSSVQNNVAEVIFAVYKVAYGEVCKGILYSLSHNIRDICNYEDALEQLNIHL